MIRYDNTIYHGGPPRKNVGKDASNATRRLSKNSAKRAELRRRIATCNLILRYNGSDSDAMVCRKHLQHYEHKLSTMKDTQHRVKRTYKKRTQAEIRKYTLAWIDGAKASGESFVTAEDIAFQLNVKPHFVKQVLRQLNVEGIVYQKVNVPPHDSKRDMWGGNDSSWCASKYYFRNKNEEGKE